MAAGAERGHFREAEPERTGLLRRFGPRRHEDRPREPFWRRQKDGVWEVRSPSPVPMQADGKRPTVPGLRSPDVKAGFAPGVRAALTADPQLAGGIAASVLAEHFPESLREDVLGAAGLALGVGPRERDPRFRDRVLKAYEYRCAVCGFGVRVGSVSVALDAAHIRWHQAGGPDTEVNGLALCVLHHKVFDLGAFTVSGGVVLVSEHANGGPAFEQALLAHHGRPVRPPQNPGWRPHPDHLGWHWREVLKKEPRCLG